MSEGLFRGEIRSFDELAAIIGDRDRKIERLTSRGIEDLLDENAKLKAELARKELTNITLSEMHDDAENEVEDLQGRLDKYKALVPIARAVVKATHLMTRNDMTVTKTALVREQAKALEGLEDG